MTGKRAQPDTAVVGLSVPFVLTLTLAVLCIAGCGGAAKGGGSTPNRPPSPPPHQLLKRLVAAAHGAPVPAVTRLRHPTPAGLWSLNAVANGKWFCFALGVPHVTIESTCATRSQISSEKVLIYPGAEAGQRRDGTNDYVVYGVVSARVRSLALGLSDCTRLRVPLNSRPLFWLFVPRAKLAHRILPTRLRAAVGSHVLGRRFRPIVSSARGRCVTGH